MHHLIDPLADLPVAVLAQVGDGAANMLQHWQTTLIRLIAATDENRQVAVGGADIRAAQRRIEHLDATRAQGVGDFDGQLRRRAAQIDEDQLFIVRFGDAVFAAGNFFHIVRLQ